MGELETAVSRASDLLRHAKHAVVFTGAGISTPSGIPDFRSANTGLWIKDDPMQVASLSAFLYRPERFFNWLRPLVKNSWQAQPNAAHYALAEMERAGIVKAVITQNIDTLHHRAGSVNVFEVHGSMRTLTCHRCNVTYPTENFLEAFLERNEMPFCPQCQKLLKPNIVLFEEMLPAATWSKAEEHCRRADVIFVVGSSLEVSPANSLPYMAVLGGARLLINNLTPTYLDEYAEVLMPYNVVEIIPLIQQVLCPDKMPH